MSYSREVTDYISVAPADQFEILEKLREIIHTAVTDTTEAIKWNMPVFSNSKNFCYLQMAKNHVSIGFYNPEKIEDTDNLLEGSGSVIRHLKIKSVNDIDVNQLTKWLRVVATD